MATWLQMAIWRNRGTLYCSGRSQSDDDDDVEYVETLAWVDFLTCFCFIYLDAVTLAEIHFAEANHSKP